MTRPCVARGFRRSIGTVVLHRRRQISGPFHACADRSGCVIGWSEDIQLAGWVPDGIRLRAEGHGTVSRPPVLLADIKDPGHTRATPDTPWSRKQGRG